MTERIMHILQGWQRLSRAVEGLLIDNISATLPWLTPVIPSWLIYTNLKDVLGFPIPIAAIGGAVTEGLGLACVSTAYSAWTYNNDKRLSDKAAPFWLASGMVVIYLLTVISVNALLDNGVPLVRFVKALLTVLSIVAAVTLAIRSQHARQIEAIAQERQERKKERQNRKITTKSIQVSEIPREAAQKPLKQDWRHLSLQERQQVAGMSCYDIQRAFGISDRTARGWRLQARAYAGNGHKPVEDESAF